MTVKQIIENIIEDYYTILQIVSYYHNDEYIKKFRTDFREDISKLQQIMGYNFLDDFDY